MNTTETKQTRYLTCADTAKELRKALKAAFSDIKFSVRCHHSSIRVSWTDGPTDNAVRQVSNKFEGASYDSSEDLKSYRTSILNGEVVNFGADFIHTDRKLSVDFLANITTQYCKRYNEVIPEIKTKYDGDAYLEEDPRNYWGTENCIMRKAKETNEQDLGNLFAKEDAELAERAQWLAAREAEKAAMIEESPVVEQEEIENVAEAQSLSGDFVVEPDAVAEEVIEASEPAEAQEEQEKYIAGSNAPNVYRFDPVSRIHWLEFPDKPDEETRKLLKSEGWRWSSYRQQWHTNRRWAKVPDGIPYYNEGTCDYSAERADRLEARAEKASQRGKTAYDKAHYIGSFIPMGQPILIGHHSERRHRRDLERIDNNMRTFVNESDKAKRLEEKAEDSISHRARLESPGVISRRIKRLEATLRRLERQREHWSDKAEYSRRVALLTQEINENRAKLAQN